ncbi:translation initiation factor IF-2 [Maricaulis maris]|jgi:translation initiation factor IF-2|uniref:Translation initiation factor IF-2 n=1 Tax=Maricaulis maris (strain MCS10) TaxID=394221 RepID=IF2_MARMM|nr:translation initiation factor IF-2 [Maricaulis maris]Q0AK69.1 RecName: Full=Translation initiation factor IF-2 [Maricaulis maris MCS10]ABI67324.1 bacterial translation initiation factor 2 (bIF-2) [Maricaulis maris MCS10]
MSDADDNNSSGRRPLSLKRSGGGTVQQSFARGRSKAVVVEKKRKRVATPAKDGGPGGKQGGGAKGGESALAAKARQLGLSEEELVARQRAIARARAEAADREAQKKQDAAAMAQRAASEQRQLEEQRERVAREAREAEEAAQKAIEDEARLKAEAEAATAAKDSGRKRDDESSRRRPPAKDEKRTPEVVPMDEASALEALGGRVKRKGGAAGPGPAAKQQPARAKTDNRRRGKLTIQNILEGDEERQRSLASVRRAREREKQRRQDTSGGREKIEREVVVPEAITVADLANRMAERSVDVIKYMMKQGQMVRMNDVLDADTAELVVEDFGHIVKRVSEADVEQGFIDDDDADEAKLPRAPVIAVMGHVDHGKTSLLDALRSTDIASGEAGGITQHIGAYQVELKGGQKITFLDTPGHAAFSAMRSRGAMATDIVILVVAADDSVKPQTIEAIHHAKAAGTPIIVAVNKCDKHEANPQKVLTDLLQHEIVVEAMSGEVQSVNVSAKTREGLDELTEAIALQAELLDLKANPERSAEGIVIESQVDKGRGPVATLLVRRGTLKRGEIVVAGAQWGRVRALVDARGQQLPEAGPSLAVEILGLDGAPDPGELFAVVDSESRAREIADYRQRKGREATGGSSPASASLEQMMARLKQDETQEMPLLVKSDVQGSAEAIKQSLEGIGNDEVRARIIRAAPGGVNESDVLLAKSSGAPVFAFNVRANKQARELAEREGVEIRYYSVIYDVIDDVRNTMEGMLAPEKRENFIGYAEILEVFNITKTGKVAGCRVTEGVVRRGCGVRLLRDDTVLHEGKLKTLKRFKDEVSDVRAGTECGMAFEKYEDLRKGDQIECFEVIEVARKLEA